MTLATDLSCLQPVHLPHVSINRRGVDAIKLSFFIDATGHLL
jgi:hypothetical protein